MKKHNVQGMTLVEILIAVLVFSVALGALLSCLATIVDLIDISRDQTTANTDLKNMLEQIRATPFDSLTAKFTNGFTDGPASNNYTNLVGGYTLRNEHITVSYANPNTDPLEIKVLAAWQNKKGRAFNTSISTFRTR